MAQLAAKGKLKVGDEFVHESIIGSIHWFWGLAEQELINEDKSSPRRTPDTL
ncbi:proline racemase [Bradyrhizobium sp. AZCC 2230]